MIEPLIGIILTIAIIAGVLSYMTKISQREYSMYTYGDFFREDENVDVLFLGSSKVINDIYPMQLWKDYGIESFNYGVHGNYIPASYWLMMNAFDYKLPKLVVIDAYHIGSDYKYGTPEYLHNWMDTFRLSKNKVKAIIDLNDDPAKDEKIASGELDASTKASMSEFLWNYILYHSRWNELYEQNFVGMQSYEKGAEARLNVVNTVNCVRQNEEVTWEETNGTNYLRKLLNECSKKGVKVLVTYLPNGGDGGGAFIEADMARSVAEECGADFVSFLSEDLISATTDYYDNEHLNPLGAYKITDYLGEYIATNYQIEDKRQSVVSGKWSEDYKNYIDFKQQLFERTDTLTRCLLLLKDRDFDSVISVTDISAFLGEDDTNINLLVNMGCNIDELSSIYYDEGRVYVVISDGKACCERVLSDEYEQLLFEESYDESFFLEQYTTTIIEINRESGKVSRRQF